MKSYFCSSETPDKIVPAKYHKIKGSQRQQQPCFWNILRLYKLKKVVNHWFSLEHNACAHLANVLKNMIYKYKLILYNYHIIID